MKHERLKRLGLNTRLSEKSHNIDLILGGSNMKLAKIYGIVGVVFLFFSTATLLINNILNVSETSICYYLPTLYAVCGLPAFTVGLVLLIKGEP